MRLLPTLPPWLSTLPGASRRRRAVLVAAAALLVFLLRPLSPFLLLPGWVVGGLLIWAVVELLYWSWAPRRWR